MASLWVFCYLPLRLGWSRKVSSSEKASNRRQTGGGLRTALLVIEWCLRGSPEVRGEAWSGSGAFMVFGLYAVGLAVLSRRVAVHLFIGIPRGASYRPSELFSCERRK